MRYSLDDNKTHAPDGSYYIVDKRLDYNNNISEVWKNYKSKTKVLVSGGLIETSSLLKATKEINKQCGYWGTWLEKVNFNHTSKTFDTFVGS